MEEAQVPEAIDLRHVASLSMAIWIYLMRKDETAREEIATLADVLSQTMFVDEENSNEQD